MTGRIYTFEALDNFRDYGDYGTAAGRVTRGRLFRSAHHARASNADLARLAEFSFTAIVDLRRPGERRGQPSRRPEGWSGTVIESDHDDGAEAPHIAFLKASELTVVSARSFMQKAYRQLPFEPPHIDLFSRYFRVLAASEGPVLIHCAAGKDRTGMLAALTHHLLDVHRDDLIEDYLLTNRAVAFETRMPAMMRRLEELTGRTASPEAVAAFLGVEAEWLDAAFSAIVDVHGSLDGYLKTALGVDSALRERIREKLLS